MIAIPFTISLFAHWSSRRPAPHLFWWGLGVAFYGLGTALESAVTLFGWNPFFFRSWYVAGALLGGAPLAQGTVYLLLKRRTAHLLAATLIITVVVAAVCVWMSPIEMARVEPHRLSGAVLEWRWTRRFSPFINSYAALFLIGGAIWSGLRYAGSPSTRHRAIGNGLIALGAILPGIGGSATRAGFTEVLYVTELLGLILIWWGYRLNVRGPRTAQAPPAARTARA